LFKILLGAVAMSKIIFANTLLGLVLAAGAALAGNASAQGVDYYKWDGLCADCVPTGDPAMPVTAMLGLKNYTGGIGNGILADSFVSFTYQRPDNFSILADTTSANIAIGGWVPAAGAPAPYFDVDAYFTLAWNVGTEQYSFTTSGKGGWMLALNGLSLDEHEDGSGHSNEYHESSHFHFDHHDDDGGHTSPVPEPETYAMLLAGLGLVGFAARRRKLKSA
jgi:hypothetical protein